MTNSPWKPAPFFISTADGVESRRGKIYNGLGYDLRCPEGALLSDPAVWALTHLGTGLSICFIEGDEAEIAAIATEFAEAGDWDFDEHDGWQNTDPGLRDRAKALIQKHRDRAFRLPNNPTQASRPELSSNP